ncbi:MAG: DUF1080 domain-containing protein [Sphingomicrobium sp.]
MRYGTALVAIIFVCLPAEARPPRPRTPAAPVINKIPGAVPDSAWTPLFNGKDLTGWTAAYAKEPLDGRPASALFAVENGTIHAYPTEPDGSEQVQAFIETNVDYKDYRISLEYKWGTKKFPPRMDLVRDAGLVYHIYENPEFNWPHGVEAQIQEGDTGDLWAISSLATSSILPETQRYARHADGGVSVRVGTYEGYERIRHGALNEVPGWNTLEVIVRGDTSTHIVNGFVNMRTTNLKKWDSARKAWVPLTHGRILLQAEYAEVYYRNIRIRPLTAEEMKAGR